MFRTLAPTAFAARSHARFAWTVVGVDIICQEAKSVTGLILASAWLAGLRIARERLIQRVVRKAFPKTERGQSMPPFYLVAAQDRNGEIPLLTEALLKVTLIPPSSMLMEDAFPRS